MGGRSFVWIAGIAIFCGSVAKAEDFGPDYEYVSGIAMRHVHEWNAGLAPGADFRWLFRGIGPAPEPESQAKFSLLTSRFYDVAKLIGVSFGGDWAYERVSYLDPTTPFEPAFDNGFGTRILDAFESPYHLVVRHARLRDWSAPGQSVVPGGKDWALFREVAVEVPRPEAGKKVLVYEPEAVWGTSASRESRPANRTTVRKDQVAPSPYYLVNDVTYFPAAPEKKITLAANEEPAVIKKSTPSLPAPLPAVAAPPASPTPAPAAVTPPAAPLSKQRRQRRAKWSETLQTPAAMVVDPAETVTLGDLLERIRKQHGLPVRVDLAHVLPMTAMAEMTTARLKSKASPNATVRSIGPGITLPFGVSPTYYPDPAAVPTYSPADGSYEPGAVVPYAPVAPARPGSPVPLQAYKPVAVSEKEEPVSAIQAEVIGDSLPEPPQPPKMPPVVAEPDSDGDQDTGKSEVTQGIQKMLTEMLSTPVDTAVINQTEATVEDLLRQAFDRSFPLQTLINASLSEEIPMLTSLSRATEWDLLIQDDGVLLTTRLNANLHKETRVYSVKALEKSAGLKAEDVARVLTRTVRPWSWKQNFPAAVTADKPNAQDKSKTGTKTGKKYSVPKINFDLSSLISASPVTSQQELRLVNNPDGTTTVVPDAKSENVEISEEDLELLRRAWDGLFQGAVSSIQVIYHADPPTGVLEVLPGMLVISQSQGAHREIADLIEQLSDPAN